MKIGRGADFNRGHRPSIATFYALVATIFQMGPAWMQRADTSDGPGRLVFGGGEYGEIGRSVLLNGDAELSVAAVRGQP